jgi:hypothetical protein
MSQSRQLAAIMFTDISGFTSLMGNDEQKAHDILKKNRALQKPIIGSRNLAMACWQAFPRFPMH